MTHALDARNSLHAAALDPPRDPVRLSALLDVLYGRREADGVVPALINLTVAVGAELAEMPGLTRAQRDRVADALTGARDALYRAATRLADAAAVAEEAVR